MQAIKYIRRHIFRWHRVTSILVALPVLLWSLSGFLYPVFNYMKPDIRNHSLPQAAIDINKIKLTVKEALEINYIHKVQNVRIVKLYNLYYYQVEHINHDTLTYINCNTGKILQDGDKAYAIHLAQRFLWDTIKENNGSHLHHSQTGMIGVVPTGNFPGATNRKAKPEEISFINSFNKEYKMSNKILPVYRVSFGTEDHTRLYIDPVSGKLVTAINDQRAWFSSFFGITHSWNFLDGLGKTKSWIIGIISLVGLFSALSGFYVYNIANGKKRRLATSRRWHRNLGNMFLITTFLYSASGAWHALIKLQHKPEIFSYSNPSVFMSSELDTDLSRVTSGLNKNENLTGLSLVSMGNENYWQLGIKNGKKSYRKYLDFKTLSSLQDGDRKYAVHLASVFTGKKPVSIDRTRTLNAFNNSYSMMNKRLPVVQVSYPGANYFIETSTSCLAGVNRNSNTLERFSFSNFHMHHYWEAWLGKKEGTSIKNVVLAASNLGLLLLALTGILIYLRRLMKK